MLKALSYAILGTSVAFMGATPSASASQFMFVSIDNSTPFNTSYSDKNPPTYRQWYQSPTLSAGTHTISLTDVAGASLDYAVVTAGNGTPLNRQSVIVDNDDPAIAYSKKYGKWTRNMGAFNSGPNPDGYGFGNTTADSSWVGSSFSYKFSGEWSCTCFILRYF